mmetsp:Transcript_35628/g.88638  ORF Transcript_35628/g.88638 Transcript_35628/m.88638 type:complete len:256 (-) Transcript_35628:18-785(-)
MCRRASSTLSKEVCPSRSRMRSLSSWIVSRCFRTSFCSLSTSCVAVLMSSGCVWVVSASKKGLYRSYASRTALSTDASAISCCSSVCTHLCARSGGLLWPSVCCVSSVCEHRCTCRIDALLDMGSRIGNVAVCVCVCTREGGLFFCVGIVCVSLLCVAHNSVCVSCAQVSVVWVCACPSMRATESVCVFCSCVVAGTPSVCAHPSVVVNGRIVCSSEVCVSRVSTTHSHCVCSSFVSGRPPICTRKLNSSFCKEA